MQIMALETKRMGCFFVPSLGPAPRWCSFMENLTEELEEETQAAVYDDYHFVTKEELDKCAFPPHPPEPSPAPPPPLDPCCFQSRATVPMEMHDP